MRNQRVHWHVIVHLDPPIDKKKGMVTWGVTVHASGSLCVWLELLGSNQFGTSDKCQTSQHVRSPLALWNYSTFRALHDSTDLQTIRGQVKQWATDDSKLAKSIGAHISLDAALSQQCYAVLLCREDVIKNT